MSSAAILFCIYHKMLRSFNSYLLTLIVFFLNFWIASDFSSRLSTEYLFLVATAMRTENGNKSTNWTNWSISTLSSTELGNIFKCCKKKILRNVLVWTCINLWIIMLNEKLYKILQRFYCCGSKVVLNRLLSDMCEPMLCSRAAKISFFTVSHFIWSSASLWDLKYGTSHHLKCDSSGRPRLSSRCGHFLGTILGFSTRWNDSIVFCSMWWRC